MSPPAPGVRAARILSCLALSLLTTAGATLAQPPVHGGGPVPMSICTAPAGLEGMTALSRRDRDPNQDTAPMTQFADPIGGGMNSFGQTVINYVDLVSTSGVGDWRCGGVTYDGHRGVDTEITDFYQMDEGVPALAAAPGVVVYTHDGEFDRNTTLNASAIPNGVILLHADGSRSCYWNLRKNSVRVHDDQQVATGDTLGMVGSSGYSSSPHLHFETVDGETVDPFHGSCQAGVSRWVNQGPYVMDLPFQLMSHGLTTIPVTWPVLLEKPPSKTHVSAGKMVYSWIRARNAQATDVLSWKFYANGALWAQYSFSPSGTYASSWWYLNWTISTTNYGSWRIDVLRNNVVIAQQFFTYDAAPNQPPVLGNRSLVLPTSYSYTDVFPGTDPDGSISRYEVIAQPRHGTLQTFAGRARKYTYRSLDGYVGRDTFQVRPVDDENVPGAAATYAIDVVSSTAVDPQSSEPALRFAGVTPNPIAGMAEIAYTLPRAGHVTVEVYGPDGARVRTLEAGDRDAGRHTVAWNTRDGDGREVPAGIYFVRVRDGRATVTRRVVVAR